MTLLRLLLLVLIPLLGFSACVGARKYKQVVSEKAALDKEHREKWQASEQTLAALHASEQHLRDELISQNTLLSGLLADKLNLEKEISALQATINQMNNESESAQAMLNQELQRKNASLQRKEEILNQLVDRFMAQEEALTLISTQLADVLSSFTAEQIEWYLVDRHLKIVMYNAFAFSNSQTLQPEGQSALDRIATLIKNHPSFLVVVEGHTDNASEAERSLELGATRAISIAKYLLDPGGINSNQVQVSSRGGYAPRVSNQTPAGQQMNNRVEIQLHPPDQEIFSIIKDQTN